MNPTAPAQKYRLVAPVQVVESRAALNPTQARVVAHRGGPLLVLAGPGTGKTSVIVESVAARIEQGADPESVLVLTFSRAAAADIRRRIALRLGRSVHTPHAMTFHAFCYSVLRRYGDPSLYGESTRLLSAPEQDFRVREVLGASAASWPQDFTIALGTRGFATEVRNALATVRQLGLGPDSLGPFAQQAQRPEWAELGVFFDEYLDVLEAEGVLDYAELVHRTRVLLADPEIGPMIRRSAQVVYVDEFQDTDPAQVGLLRQLVPRGGEVLAVGDPDQSIYQFRGASQRGILDFPDVFTTVDGSPAPVIALDTNYRSGATLLAATRRVASRLGLPRALPPAVMGPFRDQQPTAGLPDGEVEVYTYDDAGAQAQQIADLLRRAHLQQGYGWDEMAILVRSGRHGIPPLSRALVAAGVPVTVAGDDIALAAADAVKPFLLALQVVAAPDLLDVDVAVRLLSSPLCALDSMQLRRLGRALRQREEEELAGLGSPGSSDQLVRDALAAPDRFETLPDSPEATAAAAFARLLERCRALVAEQSSAHEVLWELWTGTTWPQRLTDQLGRGGDATARANRDLDAICALFDLASRSDEVTGGRGVLAFLAEVSGQEIPADTGREDHVPHKAVRLLTAHRSKGLEWPLVVVAGVQEGSWPDPRRRATLLQADRITADGAGEPPSIAELLAAERRLFYVACTRARRRLVVTAVSGTEGEGDQPSRFLAELGVPIQAVPGRPRRPLSLAGLVGELRRVATAAGAHPSLHEAAAVRLAYLADQVDRDGRPLVPAADPANWWGLATESSGMLPRDPEASVRLSGSQVSTVLGCPRQWFLQRRAAGEAGRSSSASFGSVVHILAEHAVADGLSPDQLRDQLDRVWDDIGFDAAWLSASERAEADEALERLASWNESVSGRTVLGVELGFEVEMEVAGVQLRLSGTVDRLDVDAAGRLVVVDFKTSRRAPSAAEAASNAQLGVYQLAIELGAFDDLAGRSCRAGGGELVYLRVQDGQQPYPKVLRQPALSDVAYLPEEPSTAMLSHAAVEVVGQQHDHPTWVHHRLAAAAHVLAEQRYVATVGANCSWCQFANSCPAQPQGRQVLP